MNELPSLSFAESIKLFYSNLLKFEGRSRRSELFYPTLLFSLLFFLFIVLFAAADGKFDYAIFVVVVFMLVSYVGLVAVLFRRFQDIGKPGKLAFCFFIPGIGYLILLYLLLMDSCPGDNEYGKSTKYVSVDSAISSSEKTDVKENKTSVTEKKSEYKAPEHQQKETPKPGCCPSCGRQVPDSEIFCPHCGAILV